MKHLRILLALTLIICGLPVSAFAATPVASSFSTTVAANRQNRVVLQGSDSDGTALTYATTSTPSHGALSALDASGGAVIYTPNADYVGSDSFTYTVTSGGETSAAGTVTLTVTNQKTRIIDTVTDASGAPRAGKVTFILTQPVTSPGGLTPKGASVSATLNNFGQFDISVYPSRSLSPAAYYQVYFTDSNANQILLGIYDIPLSTETVNLAPYKVVDTNLAAQYTFASQAAVTQLTTAVASATASTLLGTSPTNNALQKYNSTSGKFANSSITDTGSVVAVASNTTVDGTLTTTGAVTAENLALPAATRALISAGQVPYSADVIKGLVAFYDATKLDLAEGDAVSSWTDLSGNGRHAVQATGSLQPIYHQSEAYTNTRGGAYVAAADTADYLTAPLPASGTKVFCSVVHAQTPHPSGYTLYLDAQNWLSQLAGRWASSGSSAITPSTPIGYSQDYSVVCLRMNSATSHSVFVDGVLAQTYTPADQDLAAATSIKIGPGFGRMKQLAVLDYGRAMTDAEVQAHSEMLAGHNLMTWEIEFVGRTATTYAPMLDSEAIIVKRRDVRGKRPLVILNHQAAQNERVFFDATEQRAVTTALVEAGYIVAFSRQYSASAFENSWGNDEALDANADLYDYIVSNYQVDTSRVAMVGFSMGGISTALAFPDGRIPLKGAGCFDCAFDLAHVYANGFSSAINAAYNVGGSNYATATAGHDPRLLGAHASFTNTRWAFFANTDDSILNFTQNTSDFQAQIASVTTEETITSASGAGGHLAGIQSNVSNLTAFLARCFQ